MTVWGYGDSLREINARVPGRNKINCHRNFRHRNFQSLFDAGIRTLDILDEQFEHFVRWSDAIFECKAKYYNPDLFSPIPEFPKGPEFLDCKITCSTLGTSTITELLERTADDVVREALRSESFSSSEAHNAVDGFFYTLHSNICAAFEIRDDTFRSVLRLGMIKSVLIPFTSYLRNSYYREVRSFRLAVMRQTPLGTRTQDKAINLVATNMIDLVRNYLTHDSFRFVGRDGHIIDIDTRKALLEGHAAILTQIHHLMS